MKGTVATALRAAELFTVASGSSLQRKDNVTMVYSFNELEPSPELKWTPCWDNFTCAMLEVKALDLFVIETS